MKSRFNLTLLALCVIAVFGACKKSSNTPTPLPSNFRNFLVYIYQSDSTDGVAFKNLLQANECSVTLVDKSKMGALDYSLYSMVIIGGNSDSLHSPNPWTATNVMPIKNAGKRVFLIGEGGLLFAGALGDTVNWGTSAGNYLTVFKAIDPTNTLYKQPKTITIGADSLVTIYSAASKLVSFYTKNKPVPNVTLIGQEADISNSKYYPIALDNSAYLTFGFYDNMDKMTATGKDFFVNLVFYAGTLTQ